jgi:hypothetical protein
MCIRPIVAGQRIGKIYRGNEYTRNKRRIAGSVIFYAGGVV